MERKALTERKCKLEGMLKSSDEEGLFVIGSDRHITLEKFKNMGNSTSSVCRQQDNFFGFALKYRQTLNN